MKLPIVRENGDGPIGHVEFHSHAAAMLPTKYILSPETGDLQGTIKPSVVGFVAVDVNSPLTGVEYKFGDKVLIEEVPAVITAVLVRGTHITYEATWNGRTRWVEIFEVQPAKPQRNISWPVSKL